MAFYYALKLGRTLSPFVGAYRKAVERLNSESTKSSFVEDKNVQYRFTIGLMNVMIVHNL